VVLIASPGFLREDFLKWMFLEAVRNGDKAIIENKNKFVACQASSGFKSVSNARTTPLSRSSRPPILFSSLATMTNLKMRNISYDILNEKHI
jgi:hypothetical protein